MWFAVLFGVCLSVEVLNHLTGGNRRKEEIL